MQTVKGVALCLCAVLVATSGVTLLLPDARYKKLISYILSLVIILSVIGAVSGTKLKLSIPAVTQNTQSIEAMTSQQAALIIKAYLQENGIQAKEVVCYMDILQNGDIVINKACVYTAADPNDVTALLKDGFGVQEVEIYDE